MKNSTKIFYNTKVNKNAKQLGLLSRFYYILNRFETHRSQATIDLIKNDKYDYILDIGCYDGSLLYKLNSLLKPKKIFGCDIHKNAIIKCQNIFRNTPNEFKIIDINENLKYPSNYFDLITIIAVLEHTFNPVSIIKMIYKMLKKNGILIVEVPNIAFLKHRINLFFGLRPRTSWDYGWDGGHMQLFTFKDLSKLLEDNGFTIISSTGSGIFAKLRNIWKSLLFSDIIIKAKK